MVNVYDIIAKHFWNLLDDILVDGHTHYWLKGGRGSAKSSFVGIVIPLLIMIDADNGVFSNAVAMRKVGDTITDSVYSQLLWGLEMLGVENLWRVTTSPLCLTYTPTGQQIKFRSMANKDDHRKVKSTKFKRGFCKYLWFEELDEFFGMEEIRSVRQSLLRGGDKYKVFYTYNPPKMIASWVNAEALNDRADMLVHSSTYLDVPIEWLGEQFVVEAEELKRTNELAYRNEYLGEATGTGGAVFTNVSLEDISDEQIAHFDLILDGIDFGYAVDPSCYLQMYYDKKKRMLYIFNEIYKVGLSNRQLFESIKAIKVGGGYITCDSAEPRSIDELKSMGLRVRGAKKGPDSIEYGVKWLQMLPKIVIDKRRCPNTAREFTLYEYEKDKFGSFKSKYPDENNHSIDCVRYAMEEYSRPNTWQLSGAKLM